MNIRNIITAGDWTLVTQLTEKHNKPKSCSDVKNYKDKLDLIDIWRQFHPNITQYTWKQLFYKKWQDKATFWYPKVYKQLCGFNY